MRKIRKIAFVFILLFLVMPELSCQQGGAQGVMSCSPVSGLNFEGDTAPLDTSSLDFEGGPVSLPITIAKLDGVDASSMTFQAIGSGSQLVDGGPQYQESIVGNILFYLVGQVCQDVGVIVDGEFTTTLVGDSNNNCLYQYAVTADLADAPIAFVVLDQGSTISNNGATSYPVVGIVNSPSGEIEEFSLTVLTTLLDADMTNQDYNVDIQSGARNFLTVSGVENVIFPVIDSGGNSALWAVPVTGGKPELFKTVSELPTELQYADNLLAGRNASNEIFKLLPDASLTNLSPQFLSDESLSYRLHPSGKYLAYPGVATNNNTGNPTLSTAIIDVENDTMFGFDENLNSNSDIVSMELSWLSTSVVAALAKSATQYFLFTIQVGELLSGGLASSAQTTLLQSGNVDDFVSTPLGDGGVGRDIYFLCEDQNTGVVNLCTYDTSQQDDSTVAAILIDIGKDVKPNFRLSKDGISYIVFEIEDEKNTIGILNLETLDINFPVFGRNPQPSPTLNNLITYVTEINGSTQVGLLNLANDADLNPSSLQFLQTSISSGVDRYINLFATGGEPPYSFERTAGSGTLNANSGTYLSSVSENSIIQVTDSVGETATVTVKTFASSDFDTDFSNDGQIVLVPTIGATNVSFNDVARQSDGKLVAVGRSLSAMFIARFNSDGSVDTSFSDDGFVLIDPLVSNVANAVVIDNDGKIVVAGSNVNGNTQGMLVRLNTDGSLDPTFGVNGQVITTHAGTSNFFTDVAIDSNGRIIAVGSGNESGTADFLIAVFSSNGSVDMAFNATGRRTYDLAGGSDTAYAVEILGDDNFFVVGNGDNGGTRCIAQRFGRTNGGMSIEFNAGAFGEFLFGGVSSSCEAMYLDTQAAYVGGSRNGVEVVVARMSLFGVLDTTFSDDGFNAGNFGVSARFGFGLTFAELSNGNKVLYLAGQTLAKDGLVIRFTEAGALDTSFSGDGAVLFDQGVAEFEANNILVQPDGLILVTGIFSDQAALYRIWP